MFVPAIATAVSCYAINSSVRLQPTTAAADVCLWYGSSRYEYRQCVLLRVTCGYDPPVELPTPAATIELGRIDDSSRSMSRAMLFQVCHHMNYSSIAGSYDM